MTQIWPVTKTLMSVSKIASKGNRVVLDDDGSFIEDKCTEIVVSISKPTWVIRSVILYSDAFFKGGSFFQGRL